MELQEVCRLCRANSKAVALVDIFEQLECEEWEGELEPTLLEMLRLICENCLILPGDALPQNICLSCKMSVTNTFRFKRMCEDSHLYFCKLVVEMQSLQIKQEPVSQEQVQEADLDKQQIQIDCDQEISIQRVQCEYCSEDFDSRSGLYDHQKKNHSNENIVKPYTCADCGKGFVAKSHLTRHTRTHTGERPFKCTECPRDFIQDVHLKIHLREHTGERPFQCTHCPKSFARRDILTGHLRIHAKQLSENSLQLDTTNTNQEGVKTDITEEDKPPKKRKVHFCPTCNKMFMVKSDLTRHIRMHTGERPFKCSKCSQDFKQRHHLNRHLQEHSNEKIYKCPHCTQHFTRKGSVQIHVARMHSPSQLVVENVSTCPDIDIKIEPTAIEGDGYEESNEANRPIIEENITGDNQNEVEG